ncbi:hexosaminidase [Bacteroides luti]|uniref:beta-N-acetylhexosaminidase n=1 Tax=Bacteroides luti TaxID=1297750 RepID=A0A1M5FXW2_9BACE|nr:family 20 glycosylhydrolase [Bacteroides luti]SHF96012.1 hexosaminidase [Bacteroides luti]
MLNKKIRVCLLVALIMIGIPTIAKNTVSIVPKPLSMEEGSGVFNLKSGQTITATAASLRPAAEYLQQVIGAAAGTSLKVSNSKNSVIQISLDSSLPKAGAYRLKVTAKSIKIEGKDYQGVIAGIATLRQLLQGRTIPEVKIEDSPALPWRGFMLDSSRHFWSKAEVKRVLDLMALYKLNKFHWHLTDDQGWRIEIKKYPLLTEKGAWRHFNNQDRDCQKFEKKYENSDFHLPEAKMQIQGTDTLYGGFYTQDDIREVVAYATQRGIDIIPEIDMPGHFMAAISNYPDVACTGMVGWGTTFSSPICPGKDSSLEFCKNVYREVMQLFPYQYIHLGADEVEKTNWKKCPDCQRRMKEQGLNTPEQLQAWFVHNMEKFFNENGRRMIGWDEILEGGLSKTATITWWRTWAPNAVPQATAQGNQAILCPNGAFYLDNWEDKNSMSTLYNYNPLLEGLSDAQKQNIIGAQCNLWTESVPTIKRVEYLLFPRLVAFSEMVWLPAEKKNEKDFLNRLPAQLKLLEAEKVNYRVPDLGGFYETNAFIDSKTLNLTCLKPNVEIRYTTDGKNPTRSSALYNGPITIDQSTDYIFRTFRADGTPSEAVKAKFIKMDYSPATPATIQGSGLKATWHEYVGERCREIEAAPVNGEYQVSTVSIPKEVKGNIGLVLTGYLNVPADGIYTFALLSDDGSTMEVDGQLILDNDGGHSPKEITSQMALSKGLHPVKILYFDHNGGTLKMSTYNYKGDKIEWPAEWLKH